MKLFRRNKESETNVENNQRPTTKELIKLSSRFLAVVIAATASLAALTVFTGTGTIPEKIYSYIINANLAWVTLILLAYAWRWEFTGGIAFLMAAFIYAAVYSGTATLGVILLISVPLATAGILFASDGLMHLVKDERTHHTDDMHPQAH